MSRLSVLRLMKPRKSLPTTLKPKPKQRAEVGPRELEAGSPRADCPQQHDRRSGGGELLANQRPRTKPAQRHADTHGTASDERDQPPHGEPLELQLAAEQADLDADRAVSGKISDQYLQDRLEGRLADQPGDRAGGQEAEGKQEQAGRLRRPERGIDLQPAQQAALNDRVTETLIREQLAECDEYSRQRDETKVLRAEQARQHREDDEADELAAPRLDQRPGQAVGDLLLQAATLVAELARRPFALAPARVGLICHQSASVGATYGCRF